MKKTILYLVAILILATSCGNWRFSASNSIAAVTQAATEMNAIIAPQLNQLCLAAITKCRHDGRGTPDKCPEAQKCLAGMEAAKESFEAVLLVAKNAAIALGVKDEKEVGMLVIHAINLLTEAREKYEKIKEEIEKLL